MTLFARSRDGLGIAYETAGEGRPVLLVHGFASSRAQNWRATGWYKAFADAGYRVIAMDCRGHGDSDKPHDPLLYSYALMAGDILTVAAAAAAEPADIMGYSMGGHLTLELLMNNPQAIRKVVIAGVGASYLRGSSPQRFGIAEALVATDGDRVTDPIQKMFRAFAGQPGKDRVALAACMRGERRFFTSAELSCSTRPSLVVCGENDTISGPPDPLADVLNDSRATTIPGRDHMSAVGDRGTKAAVMEFLRTADASER